MLEFFREQGIFISPMRALGFNEFVVFVAIGNENKYSFKNRDYNTALTEAIRKANELVNGGVK